MPGVFPIRGTQWLCQTRACLGFCSPAEPGRGRRSARLQSGPSALRLPHPDGLNLVSQTECNGMNMLQTPGREESSFPRCEEFERHGNGDAFPTIPSPAPGQVRLRPEFPVAATKSGHPASPRPLHHASPVSSRRKRLQPLLGALGAASSHALRCPPAPQPLQLSPRPTSLS